jgi:hypothetical protein
MVAQMIRVRLRLEPDARGRTDDGYFAFAVRW